MTGMAAAGSGTTCQLFLLGRRRLLDPDLVSEIDLTVRSI